jgi:hypothetical protein
MKSKIFLTSSFLIIIMMFVSCDVFKDNELKDYKESYKDLSGKWQLKTVSRNGIDISNLMDFSQFRMNLNADGSYILENYLPFVVKNDGQWKVDDPQYPFNLIFRENNSAVDVTVGIKYPSIAGKRIISITLSPGCRTNTYVYVFEEITNN